jgi:hypothetical protein
MQRSQPVTLAELQRRNLGLSQRALAAELGWSQAKLSRFELAALPEPEKAAEWAACLERLRCSRRGEAVAR